MSLKFGRATTGIALLCCVLFAAPALAGKGGKSKKGSAAASSTRKAPTEVRLNPSVDPAATSPNPGGAQAQGSTGAPPSRGPTRIDFDDRLIQGQTNKSGAVYLYDRKELKQRSMVKDRESFREEIIRTVYDR